MVLLHLIITRGFVSPQLATDASASVCYSGADGADTSQAGRMEHHRLSSEVPHWIYLCQLMRDDLFI
jgi:hypothetical protein